MKDLKTEEYILEDCGNECNITLVVEYMGGLPYEVINFKAEDGSSVSINRFEFEKANKALQNIKLK